MRISPQGFAAPPPSTDNSGFDAPYVVGGFNTPVSNTYTGFDTPVNSPIPSHNIPVDPSILGPIPQRRLYEGGFFSDFMDTLSLPQVLLTQYFTGRKVSLTGERITPGDVVRENMEPGMARNIAGFLADAIADPTNLAMLPVKGVTLGARTLHYAGDIYKMLGKTKPIETIAIKVANNSLIKYLEGPMGLSLTRVADAFRPAVREMMRKAHLIQEQMEHYGHNVLQIHKVPDEAADWVGRYIDAGSHWREEATRNFMKFAELNPKKQTDKLQPRHTPVRDAISTLKGLVSIERQALLDSEEFAASKFAKSYKSLRQAQDAVRMLAKPIQEASREATRLSVANGVWGAPDSARAVAMSKIWEDGHLMRVYRFMNRPDELREHASMLLLDPAQFTWFGSQIAGKMDTMIRLGKFRKSRSFMGVFRDIDLKTITREVDGERRLIPEILENSEFIQGVNNYITQYADKLATGMEKKIQDWASPSTRLGAIGNALDDRIAMDPITLRLLGPITNVNTRIAETFRAVGREIAARTFYDDVADWGLAFKNPSAAAAKTKGTHVTDFLRVPDNHTYGPLAGKYIHRIAYWDIMNYTRPLPEGVSMWAKAVGTWKAFMAPRSPATQVRNFFGNVMLAHIAGDLGPWRLDVYKDALRDVIIHHYALTDLRPKYLNSAAIKNIEGAMAVKPHLTSSMITSEIKDITVQNAARKYLDNLKGVKSLPGLLDLVNHMFRGMDDFYDFSEKLFKHAVYIQRYNKNMAARMSRAEAIADATEFAQRALFNYADVPYVIDYFRRSGIMPFITYPYKAIPLLAQETIRNPQRIALWGRKLPDAITAMDPEAERRAYHEYNSLPDYVKEGFVRLPGKRGRYLAFAPYFPFNELQGVPSGATIPEAIGKFALSGSGPMIQVGFDLATGRSNFTGYPIYNDSDTIFEKYGKSASHVANAIIPYYRSANAIGRTLFSDEPQIRTTGEELARTFTGANIFDIVARKKRQSWLMRKQ